MASNSDAIFLMSIRAIKPRFPEIPNDNYKLKSL